MPASRWCLWTSRRRLARGLRLERQYGRDAIDVQTVGLLDRNVFTGLKSRAVKMARGFVRRARGQIVMKPPASTGTVNEVTQTVLTVWTPSYDPASFLMLAVDFGVDMRLGVERCNHDIGDVAVALGMVLIARSLQTNVTEAVRQRAIADRRKGGAIHRFPPEYQAASLLAVSALCLCSRSITTGISGSTTGMRTFSMAVRIGPPPCKSASKAEIAC